MKGVVFNLLEEAVSRQFGPEVWDTLIDDADVAGAYTSLGNYSDEEIVKLVAAAAAALQIPAPQVLRWFGEQAMPILKERYGSLFAGHPSSRNFILSVTASSIRKSASSTPAPPARSSTSRKARTVLS